MRTNQPKLWLLLGALACMALVVPAISMADAATVSYQGVLRTATDTPVADDAYTMVFSIWDAPTGGAKRWGDETHNGVATNNGLFSVYLGETLALGTLFTDYADLYLEVSADTGAGLETYAPRVPLASVPYALHAATSGDADTLDGKDSTSLWSVDGNAATASNFVGTTNSAPVAVKTNNVERMRVTPAGNVGVGTPTPNSAAVLELASTTQGFAMPRMTSTQRRAIVSPPDGLQVYDTTLKGFYYYNGSKWDCVSTPAGTVNWFAGDTAPTGYLECNGQSVSTTAFAELFAAIGYTHGGSGGSFNVPDLRGEFIRGWDHGRGADPGRGLGSWQAQDFKSFTLWSQNGAYSHGPVYYGKTGRTGNIFAGYWAAPGNFLSLQWDDSEIRSRNRAMMACIKY